MAVRLEFETTDSQEIELAKRYWAMDEEGAYLERVADLLPFREITQASMVAKFVRQICTAYDEINRARNVKKFRTRRGKRRKLSNALSWMLSSPLTSPVHGKRPFPTLRYLTTLYSSCKQSMHWSALCLRKGPFRWTTVKR